VSTQPEIQERQAKLLVSTDASLTWWSVRGTGLTIAVALAYFLASRLSLHLLTQPDGVAVFWPAAGLAAGVLIRMGPVARIPVVVGTIIASLAAEPLGDRNIWSAIVFGACVAGEAVFVASLIERVFPSPFKLDAVNHVIGLVLVAIVAAAVTGIGGTLGFLLFHSSAASPLTIWWHWFASGAIGVVTVAPLFIGLPSRGINHVRREEFVEGVLALMILTAATGFVIQMENDIWTGERAVATVFPLLLWIAVRCKPVFAAGAVFICSIAIVWSTTFGIGFFGDPALAIGNRVLPAQASTLAVSLCELVLAALFAERRRHVHIIAGRENRMRAIVNTVADGIITIDDKGIIENLNPAAARMFGYDLEEMLGGNLQVLITESSQREHDTYLKHFLGTDPAKLIGIGREVTGLRNNGTTFPIELAVGEMAVEGRRMFVAALHDITKRKRNAERQAMLMAELDHRVKNALARVAMLAASTSKGSTANDEYVRALNGRIQSMAAAHGLLSQSRWQNVGLGTLVRNQLAPYATGSNVTITGEEIMLSAAEIQAVAMVLHELVTNAAKHGSLSIPDGRVGVSWDRQELDTGAKLTFEWRELGGPAVVTKAPSGYGTNLIRDLIPHELGGTVDLVFAPDGVSCKIDIPLERTWITKKRS
jgi:PAS domain S-box-containing protein